MWISETNQHCAALKEIIEFECKIIRGLMESICFLVR